VNAIEAMRACSDTARELRISSAQNLEAVLVQVEDSGPGIEPKLTDQIFEPFFTTKAEGIGMGLSISRSIVESHGGHLSLLPTSQGAMFQFTLPVDSTQVS
jgi:signal transduction histidine kinase